MRMTDNDSKDFQPSTIECCLPLPRIQISVPQRVHYSHVSDESIDRLTK